eukprot:TRINITY_DN62536_c0_g1_i1.p1 TRINITY_DN62536_c0_g1~~TRINITY_DN62536_c0_g1_i1.p1  ORF type:complete len:248 (-),score=37.28 TRINITY_DN62536_c0_g1_i1:169-912(-)
MLGLACLALLLPCRVLGDGALTVSTTDKVNTVTTPAESEGGTSSPVVTANCNPFKGYRYYRISNAGAVMCGNCACTWDLAGVEAWTSDNTGESTATFRIHSDAGSQGDKDTSHLLDNDHSLQSYWYGSHDSIGDLGSTCWDLSKVGKQWVIIEDTSQQPGQITRMRFHQGGSSHCCNVASLRIECAKSLGSWVGPTVIDLFALMTEVKFDIDGMRYGAGTGSRVAAGTLRSTAPMSLLFAAIWPVLT